MSRSGALVATAAVVFAGSAATTSPSPYARFGSGFAGVGVTYDPEGLPTADARTAQ